MASTLLDGDEPGAFEVLREKALSPFVLTCDHASRDIPRSLGTLGITAEERVTHIAWDIGAAGVTAHLAAELDAFAILQKYSRLVIDCNRPFDAVDSVPTVSEYTEIPGNAGLSAEQRTTRAAEIFAPYHDRIALELDRRQKRAETPILVAVHSFTPVFKGVQRPWHVGVLYNRDARLARPVIAALQARGDLVVGDNQPYTVSDESDYTIPVHGERRGLRHVEIEIRQDIIADGGGQRAWAKLLAGVLMGCL